MTPHTIGVTGAGQMGAGIAQVFAQAGFTVVLHDVAPQALDRAGQRIEDSLRKFAKKAALRDDPAVIRGRLTLTTEFDALRPCAAVIEAAPEDVHIKRQIFAALSARLAPQAIMATNTSSIAIAQLAAATTRPGQVIGVHFMNPVPLMPCVEVICADTTSPATFQQVQSLLAQLGKTMVVSKDRAGFIVNRVLMPMINEAAYAVQEGIATREDIDTAMRLSCNFPMGPLTLADFIGLDTVVSILEVMHRGLGEDRFQPCPLLKEYVAKGWMGKKSGQGFYAYR